MRIDKLWRAVIQRVASHFPSTTFYGVHGAYMTRYTVFHGGTRGLKLYINHIHRSDEDPDPHDHPWAWALALILAGGYDEFRKPLVDAAWETVSRTGGSLVWLTRYTRHRVELRGRPSWSLFLCGPTVQEWAFWTNTARVPWRIYLNNKG